MKFQAALIRGWSRDDYAMHLGALMTGDFLILILRLMLILLIHQSIIGLELKAVAKGDKVTYSIAIVFLMGSQCYRM